MQAYAYSEVCQASVYWEGTRLANGQRFNPNEALIAHRTLPLGTMMRVTNLRNNISIIVPVKDRGPYAMKYKRCVDLSLGAARQLKFGSGVGMVKIETL